MNYKDQILEKTANNQEVVGVIGLGYVGLPLAVNFAEAGIKTIGFDKNPDKVDKINHGSNYIEDIRDAVLKEVVENVSLSATTDFSRMKECDALLICVPTPLDKFKKPDMSFIEAACTDIGRYMKPGTFISLESTTYPTTTEEVMLPIIEAASAQNKNTEHEQLSPPGEMSGEDGQRGHKDNNSASFPPAGGTRQPGKESVQADAEGGHTTNPPKFIHGTDFWLAYSPERVDPGNKAFHTRNTPKVLGAMTPDGLEIGEAIYKKAIDTIHKVSSPRIAEMVKILENTYRLVNISLINELALLAGKMDINIWEVIDAAATKPFGFQPFYPGPGIGGHCIPLDPFYLEHIAKKYNFDLSMIHTAGHINMRMPHYMYIKIATALNRHKKAVNGSKVLFMGVAYKPNINDERESPALDIMEIVAHKGGEVAYHDPHIPAVETRFTASQDANPNDLKNSSLKSIPLSAESLAEADVVVLTTNHSAFDIDFIQKHAQMIVDMRNMIKEAGDKVYKL